MTQQLTFKTERIDDIPLLLAQLERMQVGLLLDEHFPTEEGLFQFGHSKDHRPDLSTEGDIKPNQS